LAWLDLSRFWEFLPWECTNEREGRLMCLLRVVFLGELLLSAAVKMSSWCGRRKKRRRGGGGEKVGDRQATGE
jgi:hypothetical protein